MGQEGFTGGWVGVVEVQGVWVGMVGSRDRWVGWWGPWSG